MRLTFKINNLTGVLKQSVWPKHAVLYVTHCENKMKRYLKGDLSRRPIKLLY